MSTSSTCPGRRRRTIAAVAASLSLFATTGCGSHDHDPETASRPDRTVAITMVDNQFVPSSVQVTAGETIEFQFTNDGAVDHEAFIGLAAEQDEHAEAMRSGDDHADHHGSAVDVPVGAAASLSYTFDEAGSLQIGCHEPGHFESGMVADVTVT